MEQSNSDSPIESQQKQVITIMYFALLIVPLVYGLVVYLKTQNPPRSDPNPETISTYRMIFFGISIGLVFIIRMLKRTLITSASKMNGNLKMKVQKIFVAHIITWALCESVAIYGLILGIKAHDINEYIPFLMISVFLFLRHYPKFSQWEEWLRPIPNTKSQTAAINPD